MSVHRTLPHSSSSRDEDPQETEDWIASLDSVVRQAGPERARFLLEMLERRAKEAFQRMIEVIRASISMSPG